MECSNLSLILTAQCNLRCSYCYQNAKIDRSSGWDIIKAGIDLALEEALSQIEVTFLGGEPLLRLDLIRNAVSYAGTVNSENRSLKFAIITNGTLITDTVAEYLDEHEIAVRMSFDGIQQPQSYRGKDTFEILDGVLDRLRMQYPQLFVNRLQIALTVIPPACTFLADSVGYLLDKGVRQILITPCITPNSDWHVDRIHELDAEFARLSEISLDHAKRTGTIPVLALRKATEQDTNRSGKRLACDALTGRSLTLDVDGQLYTCPMLAESYQTHQPGLFRESASLLKLGSITTPEARHRRTALAESARCEALWAPPEGCHSSYGICGECEYYGRCTVCPVSVWLASSTREPRRVPDFVCAFNRVALKHRDQFPSVPVVLKKFLPHAGA